MEFNKNRVKLISFLIYFHHNYLIPSHNYIFRIKEIIIINIYL